MAGWSMLSNGSNLDCIENKFQLKSHFEIDNSVKTSVGDCDDIRDEKNSLFYRDQSIFFKEIAYRNRGRPIPPMLGNGITVDLFILFWAVRDRGGFDSVLEKKLWANVTEELGLHIGFTSSVKLIYVNYLLELDQWLLHNHLREEVVENGRMKCRLNMSSFDCENSLNDDKIINHNHDNYHKGINSRKRKRDSFSEMLNRVNEVAKHPLDISMDMTLEGYNWNENKSTMCRDQALRAREVLFLPRDVGSSSNQMLLQNDLTMPPSTSEETKDRSIETSRPVLSPPSKPCPPTETKLETPHKLKSENVPKDETIVTDPPQDAPFGRRTLVGPAHQVLVPEWTGAVLESDPKWLRTIIWPLKNQKVNKTIQNDLCKCTCVLPGSVRCVRFHISEKRLALKLELGPAFYQWRFHCIGEEVSLKWTFEEEKRFKNMVRFNRPSLDKCFWDVACKYFPRKKRENLVSYYFNVFIVRRRSYQNRVMPKNIDSDDDENEFGSFSESYGHEAIEVPGEKVMICTQNDQCTQFESLEIVDSR